MSVFFDLHREIKERYSEFTTFGDMSKEFQQYYDTLIVAVKIDNVLKDLQTNVEPCEQIEFVTIGSKDGLAVYRRSVTFLLITAVHAVFPAADVNVAHSIGNGLYFQINFERDLTAEDVVCLGKKMREIVAEDKPIEKRILRKEDAVKLFYESGQLEKVKLIESLDREFFSIYYCGEYYDYLYGAMMMSTGGSDIFALDYYASGIILRVPRSEWSLAIPSFQPQEKLAKIFSEVDQWRRILRCEYVSNLNEHNQNGEIGDLIRVSEALHEKKVANIADYIAANIERIRLISIAGPSSSGKTTFAQRLRIQLLVNGILPISISLDDYFLDRCQTPCDEQGNYNFEALEALDVDLFNDHLIKLFHGEMVEIPYYNFVTGKREYRGNFLKLMLNQPVIIEGIHGLNEKLTKSIPRDEKYKIYISALTQISIDGHNRIPTTDARLIRRMVRDYHFRGSNALKTIRQWPSVRAGEEKNIFPYQEEADIMFNSALIYELGILKKYAEPLLHEVRSDLPEYGEATRLLDFLEYFSDIKADDEIPFNSIIKEFIGNSCFAT